MRAEDADRRGVFEARIELECGGRSVAGDLQAELSRHMTPAEKLRIIFASNEIGDAFSRAGLRIQNPGVSQREITLLLAEQEHGRDVAARSRAEDARLARGE